MDKSKSINWSSEENEGPWKPEDGCFLSRSVIKKHSLSSGYLVPETVIQWNQAGGVQRTWETHIKNLYRLQYKYNWLHRDPFQGSHRSTLTNGTNRQKQCYNKEENPWKQRENGSNRDSPCYLHRPCSVHRQARQGKVRQILPTYKHRKELLKVSWWTRHPQNLRDQMKT